MSLVNNKLGYIYVIYNPSFITSASGPADINVNPNLGPASFSICALAVSNPKANANVNNILFI